MSTSELMQRRGAMMQSRSGGTDWELFATQLIDGTLGGDVTLPIGISKIRGYALVNMTGITSLTIPDGATKIEGSSCSGCTGLVYVVIPSTITSIYGYAFNGCTSLQYVEILATAPPSLTSSAFNNANNCTFYVPDASVNTYKTTSGWDTYASRIKGISERPTT